MQKDVTKQEEIQSIIFIRAICTIGIACFHFCCYANSSLHRLMMFANGYVGEILVTVFFMVSGAVLYYNYSDYLPLKEFYKKRWLGIFPAFYLCFAIFFLVNVLSAKCLFYEPGVAPWKLIYSLFGMDGYLLDTNMTLFNPNWYLVGEWFLGALIILYLLFPLLCKGLKTRGGTILTVCSVFTLFVIQAFTDFGIVKGFRNIFGCLCTFLMGMLFIRYRNKLKSIATIFFSIVIFVITLLVKLPLPSTISTHLCGFSLFILLYECGNQMMKYRCNRLFRYIARISFPIFLVQHKMVRYIQSVWNPAGLFKSLIILAVTIILILAFAQIISASTKAIKSTWSFSKRTAGKH